MNRAWSPAQWQDIFDARLDSELDYGDQWTLDFNHSHTNNISTEERRTGWKVYKHRAYGRFHCVHCAWGWNSHNAVLSFRYRLQRGDGRGTVTLRPYGQACRSCPGGPGVQFQLPGFSPRQVTGALDKLLENIRRNCYHEDADGVGGGGGGDERPVARRHEAALCQACREGICAGPVKTFDWVVSSAGFAQARDRAGYVLTSLSVSDQDKRQIERDTVGQSRNKLWKAYRKNRITASNFGLVLKAVERHSRTDRPYPPSLFKTLRGQYATANSKAVQWGSDNEQRAKQQYMKLTWSKQQQRVELQERGVFLSRSGLLGASPDGTVRGGDRIVEVKCPYAARDMTVRQAAAQIRDFCLQIDEASGGVLTLKPGHNYWHQIQGQLHLSGADGCDLVVWTPRDLVVLPVDKDPTWAAVNVGVLETFYTEVFLPHVLSEM